MGENDFYCLFAGNFNDLDFMIVYIMRCYHLNDFS